MGTDEQDARGTRRAIGGTRRGWSLRERILARDSYGVLLVLIVAVLIATAAAGRFPSGRAMVVVLQGGVCLYALWTSRADRRVLRIALILIPVIILAAAVLAAQNSSAARAAVATAGTAVWLAAIGAIGRELITHPRITGATILGVLSTYLLIGLLFASVFATVDALSSTSFFTAEVAPRPQDFLYFSFVTLTTVGYGDLTASGDLGRMLAVTEALLGQLYLVTVVSVVVGNVGRQGGRR